MSLGTSALGVLVLVGLMAPGAGAATPRTISAPYLHTTVVNTIQTPNSGTCKVVGTISNNHWVAKTGNVTGLAASSVKSCSLAPLGNGIGQGSGSDELWVFLPVKVSNGHHNFSVSISFNLLVKSSVSGGFHCPAAQRIPGTTTYSSCDFEADSGATWGFYLYDATNRTLLSGVQDWAKGPTTSVTGQNASTCNTAGVCYWTNSTTPCSVSTLYYCVHPGSTVSGRNLTWINTGKNCLYYTGSVCGSWENWTLLKTHRYWLEIQFDYGAAAYEANFGPGLVVTSSLGAAGTSKPAWTLNSVVVA